MRQAEQAMPMATGELRMTTAAITAPTVPAAPHGGVLSRARWMVSDTLTLTRRNLLAITRIPEALFFSTIQPIMFVLLFRYVFGGAIAIPGGLPYVDYLMPGIFVQTVAFGAVSTSIGLAEDLQKGLIERFRALPMSRGAVLTGRTTADVVRNVFVVIIITVVGLAVGFRPSTGCPLLHRGHPADPAVRLRPVLGVRRHRAVGAQLRDGPGHVVPDPLPPDLHQCGVRPGRVDAELAPGVRHLPAGVGHRQRLPCPHGRGRQVTGQSTWFWVSRSLFWSVLFLIVLIPLAIRRYRTRT